MRPVWVATGHCPGRQNSAAHFALSHQPVPIQPGIKGSSLRCLWCSALVLSFIANLHSKRMCKFGISGCEARPCACAPWRLGASPFATLRFTLVVRLVLLSFRQTYVLIGRSPANKKCVSTSEPVVFERNAGNLGNCLNGHWACDTFLISTVGSQLCARRIGNPPNGGACVW